MFRKWSGWKKAAAFFAGAVMLLQGVGPVMAAEEETATLEMTGTVSHIDMSRSASAVLIIGNKTLTETVTFDAGDLSTLTVSPDYTGAVISGSGQIHITGVFLTGTYDNPVEYSVAVTKDVTFTDPDTGDIYTQTMTFSASFNYWDAGNMCPGLGGRELWSQGFVIPWSGMDFSFGSASAVLPEPTVTPEPTATPEPTLSPILSEIPLPSNIPAPTVSPSITPTLGPTVTASPSPTVAVTATPKPTVTPTSTIIPTKTVTVTAKPTITPTVTLKPTATSTPTKAAKRVMISNKNNGNHSGNATGTTGQSTAARKATNAKTGDETNLAWAVTCVLIALGAIVVAFRVLRVKKDQKNQK